MIDGGENVGVTAFSVEIIGDHWRGSAFPVAQGCFLRLQIPFDGVITIVRTCSSEVRDAAQNYRYWQFCWCHSA